MFCKRVRQIVFWGVVAMISCLCLGILPVDAGKGDFTKDINKVMKNLSWLNEHTMLTNKHYQRLIRAVAAFENANKKKDSKAKKAAVKEMKKVWENVC